MTPIEDLTKPVTVDQMRLSIYSVLSQIGVDTTVWKSGGVVRTMIAAVAIVLSAVTRLTSEIAKSGFLETASGEWLKQLALNVYGVTPIDATFATGAGVVANSSGGIYVLADGELQVTNTRTGATFVNVGPLNIPAVSSGIPVNLIATAAGSASTSLITDFFSVDSPLPGVSVSLTSALIGLDAELDPALRLRCKEKLGALSPNGPKDAYGFVARSATRGDGTPIGVTRVRVTNDGAGRVDIYVANAAGPVDSADLPFIDLAIQQQAAPLAVTAVTRTADTVSVNVGGSVYCYNDSGLSDAQIQTACVAAITDFFSSTPIGGDVIGVDGRMYRDALIAALSPARTGVPIFHVNLASPGFDISLGSSEVAVLGTCNFTVFQVPRPDTV